jgi:hypothetical protein
MWGIMSPVGERGEKETIVRRRPGTLRANVTQGATMRRAALLALAALPLLGFDCGGTKSDPGGHPGTSTLQIRGAVNEDLWCIVAATDWSLLDPSYTDFDLMLDCYRGMAEPGAVAVIFLETPPSLHTPYGWDSTGVTPVTNVFSGDAIRMQLDGDGFPYDTHSGWAPVGDDGAGKLAYTLTAIGPADPVYPGFVTVHGTLTATVPSTTPGGGAVTFSATF